MMKFQDLKENRNETKERLRERMAKDWFEIVREKMIDVAARFGIAWGEDANIRSRRFKK